MKSEQSKFMTRRFVPIAGALCLLAVYFLVTKPVISIATTFRVEIILLGVLLVLAASALLIALVSLLGLVFSKNRNIRIHRLRGQMIFLLSIVLLLSVFVAASQWLAHTPPILGEDGKPLTGSIAALEKVRLGGKNQWLILRGQDVNKPVLLFLSGGPGASEAARVVRFNQELEKDFVVVIWEQRGCGKSYPSLNPRSDLTIDQYAADIIELAEMLRTRFDEQKIYLVGHSWGSIIGVRAVQQRPDLFHAYIGTAQMVNVRETDQMIYDMIMEHSLTSGDTKFVQTLEKQGPPPYLGKNLLKPYLTLFGREYSLYEYPNIKNEAYRRDGDILILMLKQPEYGWLDRLYYLLGMMNTYISVYPQLQDLDLRIDAARLDLPVYMILGRHDMNNPYQIPEDYFNRLDAPSKQLFFFEDSGHGMIWEEPDKFYDLMVNTILAETYQP